MGKPMGWKQSSSMDAVYGLFRTGVSVPLVIDESTPLVGTRRMLDLYPVTKDKAMESLIKNGEEWMSPLLKYRDPAGVYHRSGE